jgi:hypothetical protein
MNLAKLSLLAFFAVPMACQVQAADAPRNDPPANEPTEVTEEITEDNCLGDQDLNADDIDISQCPALPANTNSIALGDTEEQVSLGAYEIGQTAEGETYKYGSLSEPNANEPRTLSYEGGSTVLNDGNVTCFAKGYYRLRAILQNPPADYIKLRDAGFQKRFFQFQTDLRNGPTGYRKISSYMDHLVKWVTLIDEDGNCVQPTLGKFQSYLTAELERRGLQDPPN